MDVASLFDMVPIVSIDDTESREPLLSAARLQVPEELLSTIGEGSGVTATIGPRPGDETAEAGDKEPAVLLDACSAALRLGVRAGMRAVDERLSEPVFGMANPALLLSSSSSGSDAL